MECRGIQGLVEMGMEEDQPEPVVVRVKELKQPVAGHDSPAVKAEKGFEEISKAVASEAGLEELTMEVAETGSGEKRKAAETDSVEIETRNPAVVMEGAALLML